MCGDRSSEIKIDAEIEIIVIIRIDAEIKIDAVCIKTLSSVGFEVQFWKTRFGISFCTSAQRTFCILVFILLEVNLFA